MPIRPGDPGYPEYIPGPVQPRPEPLRCPEISAIVADQRITSMRKSRIQSEVVVPRQARAMRSDIKATGTIRPWMRGLAEWLATRSYRPKNIELAAMASKLASCHITTNQVGVLRRRQDFQDLVSKLEGSELEIARQHFENDAIEYIDAHKTALDLALAANDYKAIPPITGPAIDRIWPKKAENESRPQVVVVNLGEKGSFAQKYAQLDDPEIVDVTFEEITGSSDGSP